MRFAQVLVLVSCALALDGCAAWQDHNEKTRDARIAFQSATSTPALQGMEKEKDNKLDGLCFQLDSGVVSQVGGFSTGRTPSSSAPRP